jgi:hypothetical protein
MATFVVRSSSVRCAVRAEIRLNDADCAHGGERARTSRRIDKLGVTGSSPVRPVRCQSRNPCVSGFRPLREARRDYRPRRGGRGWRRAVAGASLAQARTRTRPRGRREMHPNGGRVGPV